MVVATLVSALAALGALRYARDTVHETRELVRDLDAHFSRMAVMKGA
jgi:hypothetical protein